MKRLRVMHLIWSMGDGGAQRVALNYLRDFQDDPDIEFVLYVFKEKTGSYCDQEIEAGNYNVIYLDNPRWRWEIPGIRYFFNKRIAKKVWFQAIQNFNPDIVHVHISELLRYTLEPITEAKTPVRFCTLHSAPERYVGKALKINKKAFSKEHFIPLCVTREQVKPAQTRYGFSTYEVLHNGIDIQKIEKEKVSQSVAREMLRLGKEKFIVLGVGRLNKIKNFTLLLDVFSIICNTEKNALLLLAGEGEEMGNLKRHANQLGIDNRIVFMGNVEKIVPLYCSADVLSVTSLSESSSLVALEAQVCGLRCVISNGTPSESIITDRVQKMEKEATAMKWAEALMNVNYIGEPICDQEDYEEHSVSKQLKQIYFKRWREYQSQEILSPPNNDEKVGGTV